MSEIERLDGVFRDDDDPQFAAEVLHKLWPEISSEIKAWRRLGDDLSAKSNFLVRDEIGISENRFLDVVLLERDTDEAIRRELGGADG